MSLILHVSNLPVNINPNTVYKLFREVGPVEDYYVLQPQTPLNPSEHIAILFRMPDEAAQAAQTALHDHPIGGQAMHVTDATPEQSAHMLTPARALVSEIATRLNEIQAQPRTQIELLLQYKGEAFVRALLEETLEVEAKGGLMTKNGSRRRTIGGVFFYLAAEKIDAKTSKTIFRRASEEGDESAAPKAPPEPPKPSFVWSKRLEIYSKLVKGEATTVKITLVGRPGEVDERREVVVVAMRYVIKNIPLPKGMPTPPDEPTNYAVYIAPKQWRKVQPALDDPQDVLIVEGTGYFDPELQAIAVLATNVTTKMLQRAKRAQDQAAAETPKPEKSEKTERPDPPAPTVSDHQPFGSHANHTSTPNRPPSRPPAGRPPQPMHRPAPPAPAKPKASVQPSPEVLRKLAELHDQEQDARRELDEIKALPPDEQSGLTQALARLQKIKADIKALQQSVGE